MVASTFAQEMADTAERCLTPPALEELRLTLARAAEGAQVVQPIQGRNCERFYIAAGGVSGIPIVLTLDRGYGEIRANIDEDHASEIAAAIADRQKRAVETASSPSPDKPQKHDLALTPSGDRKATITVPADLTDDEVARIARWVSALPTVDGE